MKQVQKLFRTLVDGALADHRQWSSVGELAWAAGVGESWAYRAITHPVEIGAVAKLSGGGISVTDPERILMLLSSARTLSSAHHTTFEAAQQLIKSSDLYAIGGTRAAAHHLGDVNVVSDHAAAIVYIEEGVSLDALPRGNEALILKADTNSLRLWPDGFTSKAQTFADLFAQPGWQASEFRRTLWKEWFEINDWSKEGASVVELPVDGDAQENTAISPERNRPELQ